jgi:phosphate-selective porin OprO/OprP
MWSSAPRRRFVRKTAIAVAVIAPSLIVARAARADDTLPVTPTLLTQLDLAAHPQAEEGQTGFSFARFRPGLWAEPTRYAFALASVEFTAPEAPSILDGYVTLVPIPDLRFTLGYSKMPLFISARSELDGTTPLPENSVVSRALWPGRDLGAEVHWVPVSLPLEAWFRVSNGVTSPISKSPTDTDSFAISARVDATFGRAQFRARLADFFGLRVGLGAYAYETADRPGVPGLNESGYTFFQPPTVTGDRSIVEGHALGYAGPVRALVEVGSAIENRSTAGTGAPDAPRVLLDPVVSRGAAAELSWMITGQRRTLAAWPIHVHDRLFAYDKLGIELAARAERLDVGHDARGVAPSGITAAGGGATAWLSDAMSLAVEGWGYSYDAAPIDEPGRTSSWLFRARFTLFLNPPAPPSKQTAVDRRR